MKRLLPALALAATLGAMGAARAESPLDSALELKLSNYQPQIDSSPGLSQPVYSKYFGNNNILLFEAEYEYQLWQSFGSFALGGSAGYGEIYGHGVYGAGPQAGQSSGDTTALKVYPLKALAVYRFDVLSRRWNIPLVPFAKLGFVYQLYQVTNGSGGTATALNGQQGQGGVPGWEGDLGLAFLLDFFDNDVARDFDLDVGVNHSYVFAEWSHAEINDFGGKDIVFSDQFLKFGLAVEF
jgi:hypothetical protein